MKKHLIVGMIIALISVNTYIWASQSNHTSEQESVEEWIKSNENDDSPLTQAILASYQIGQNQTMQEILPSKFLTESRKEALQSIIDLGPAYTDEMLALIESNSRWSPALAFSLLAIYIVPDSKLEVVDFSENGMKQWVADFRRLIIEKE